MAFYMQFRLFVVAATFTFAAGCVGGVPRIPAVSTVQGLRISSSCSATGALMFVSDTNGNAVNIFSGSTRCGQITELDGPEDLAYNVSLARLYIANTLTQQVLIYKPPFTTVFKTLDDPGQTPFGIALCKEYIAVTNLNTGTVSIYANGATSPTSTLTDTNASSERFAACDNNGNLFTDYFDNSSVGRVNEWVGGTGSPVEKTQLSFSDPGGIKWYAGALMVCDEGGKYVNFYNAPYTQVFKTIYLTNGFTPITFAIAPNGSDFVTVDAAKQDAERYHLGGLFVSAIPVGGLPLGIAFNKTPKAIRFSL